MNSLDPNLIFTLYSNIVREKTKVRGRLGYVSKCYGFPVMTRQETEIVFDELSSFRIRADDSFEIDYRKKPTFIFQQRKIRAKDKAPLGD